MYCCDCVIAAHTASKFPLLYLRHVVIALLGLRQLLRLHKRLVLLYMQYRCFCCVCVKLVGLLCCICSAPNLRITIAANITLSLGGLDGGSWCLSLKQLNKKHRYPLSSLLYAIASMDRRGLHTSVHNPIVLQCVYPCRPYKVAGRTS